MYAYQDPDPVFGSFGAAGDWWESLSAEAKIGLVNWAADSARSQGLSADWDRLVAQANADAARNVPTYGGEVGGAERRRDALARYATNFVLSNIARSVADGGGVAFGLRCLCPMTSPEAGASAQRRVDERCPAGTGGVPATAPVVVGIKTKPEMNVFVNLPKPPGSDVRTATIKGRVVDAAGVGIPGASVVVSPEGGGPVGPGMSASVVAGADGAFSADVVPRGGSSTIAVSVEAAGYVGATASGVSAVKGQITEGVVIPLAAAVAGGGGGGGGDGGGGAYCPEGFVLASDGVSCVALGEKSDEGPRPWYKNKWTYIIGGVVIVGGGIAVAVARRR